MARRMRLCDVCGQLDDHPRHVVNHAPGSTDGLPPDDLKLPSGQDTPTDALLELAKPTVTVRHMDCCAAQGCEICLETEAANGGMRGQDLIDHLEAVRGA